MGDGENRRMGDRISSYKELRVFEEPCSELHGTFDRKERCHFYIRSLIP